MLDADRLLSGTLSMLSVACGPGCQSHCLVSSEQSTSTGSSPTEVHFNIKIPTNRLGIIIMKIRRFQMSSGPLETNYITIWIKIPQFSFRKRKLNISMFSTKCCSGLINQRELSDHFSSRLLNNVSFIMNIISFMQNALKCIRCWWNLVEMHFKCTCLCVMSWKFYLPAKSQAYFEHPALVAMWFYCPLHWQLLIQPS